MPPPVLDTDGDGLIDAVEDANDNGLHDPGETDFENPDTDGDGDSDGQELSAGTDPLDAQSLTWRSLASWRFAGESLLGVGGQTPVLSSNVNLAAGFEGNAATFTNTNGLVFLQYRAIETNGQASVSLNRGAIRLRLRTFWLTKGIEAGAVGPGEWITLVQTTNLAVRIDPDGARVLIESRDTNGDFVTNLETNIVVDSDFSPTAPPSGQSFWLELLVNYSPEETSLTWGDPSRKYLGTGITPWTLPRRMDEVICFGSAANGVGKINGQLDDIATFNVPATLGTNAWRLSAQAVSNSTALRLAWNAQSNVVADVKRRRAGETEWQWVPAFIGTNYLDANIDAGERYEYNVNTHFLNLLGTPDAHGQTITATAAGRPIEARGQVLLLVDKTLASGLEPELSEYLTNLVGDGWQIIRTNMPRHIDDYSSTNSFATNLFNITNTIAPFIRSNYTAFSTNLKHILILGHVTIPYTGNQADDGHGNHRGPWASDLYYGDMDGIWTDTFDESSYIPLRPENTIVRNDGKRDNDFVPANAQGVRALEIPVARTDFARLPVFDDNGLSETELLKRYLRKNSQYRHGALSFEPNTIGGDFLDAPQKTTLPMRVADELSAKLSFLTPGQQGDMFQAPGSFAFGMQAGPGGIDIINHGRPQQQSVTNFATGTAVSDCAFYFFRSSWFVDWNFENDFMRSVLAATNGGLATVFWLSPQAWRFDPVGAGLELGAASREVLNNRGLSLGQTARATQILGDSTLRYPVLPAPADLTVGETNRHPLLVWEHPAGIPPKYLVYRSVTGITGEFERLTAMPLAETNYVDQTAPAGRVLYMVRAVDLAITGAGSFTNISQGIFAPATVEIPDQSALEDTPVQVAVLPGETASEPNFFLLASSTNAQLLPYSSFVFSGEGAVRTLTITPATNELGSSLVTITAGSDLSTNEWSFNLTVSSVNDPPSFTTGPDEIVPQNSPAQDFAEWALDISPGPPDESDQTVQFAVTNDAPHLFSVPPAIAPDGRLTYAPAVNQRGLASISVQLRDNGGTNSGGLDASAPQFFTITIGEPDDGDGDGLPNDFELAFNLDPDTPADAGADADGDGFSNLQEFWAGTDLADASSALRIVSIEHDSSAARLSFQAAPGRNYLCEINNDPPLGPWEPLATMAGIAGALSLTDTNPIAGTRFYRVTTSGPGSGTVTSEMAGVTRLPILGNSDTIFSLPFFRPAAELRPVLSVSGDTVQVRDSPGWTSNQWVYATGTQTNTYFLLFRSGALAGEHFTIVANDENSLTLELEGAALTNAAAGDQIAIIPYWTLATAFPGGQGVHAAVSPSARNTEVLFPNLGGLGVNLSATRTLYWFNGAWRQVGQGGAFKNDDVILSDMFIWVRHNLLAGTELFSAGAVLPSDWRIPIRRQADGLQDNFVSLPRPVAVTLDQSGLFESGAFRASPSFLNRLDELLVFDNSTALKNKSAVATYYYFQNAWRKVGGGSTNRGGEPIFQPGGGVIIRSGPAAENAVWENSPSF